MKEIADLPPTLAIVLRRAGARPLAAAAASGLVGAGVSALLGFASNSLPPLAELFFTLALALTMILTAVTFRGIAAAAFVIALTGVPSVRDACALVRRNVLLLAGLEVLRVVAAVWVGLGYVLILGALSQPTLEALEALARVAGGLVAGGAGVWINARYGAFPSAILFAEGPAIFRFKDPAHRDGIAARAAGHVPLLLTASGIPFLLLAATLGVPKELDLARHVLPGAALAAPRIVAALLAFPCAMLLDAALGAAAYGIITGRLRSDDAESTPGPR